MSRLHTDRFPFTPSPTLPPRPPPPPPPPKAHASALLSHREQRHAASLASALDNAGLSAQQQIALRARFPSAAALRAAPEDELADALRQLDGEPVALGVTTNEPSPNQLFSNEPSPNGTSASTNLKSEDGSSKLAAALLFKLGGKDSAPRLTNLSRSLTGYSSAAEAVGVASRRGAKLRAWASEAEARHWWAQRRPLRLKELEDQTRRKALRGAWRAMREALATHGPSKRISAGDSISDSADALGDSFRQWLPPTAPPPLRRLEDAIGAAASAQGSFGEGSSGGTKAGNSAAGSLEAGALEGSSGGGSSSPAANLTGQMTPDLVAPRNLAAWGAFDLQAPYEPAGDQPDAISTLLEQASLSRVPMLTHMAHFTFPPHGTAPIFLRDPTGVLCVAARRGGAARGAQGSHWHRQDVRHGEPRLEAQPPNSRPRAKQGE